MTTTELAAAIRGHVVRVAKANLGYGETGANNSGRFIKALGGREGEEWCALFAGYCYRRAYKALIDDNSEVANTPSYCYRRPGVLEVGAKALVKNLGKVGITFRDPLQAKPGDLICWNRRTGALSWQGHVGVVEMVSVGGIVHTIEGNVGKFPAIVRRLLHDVGRESNFYAFAGLR